MQGWSAFIFTLGGLVMGWALTQASELIRRKDEHRRVYRQVLSYLLDFHHLVQAMRVDIKPALGRYADAMATEELAGLSASQAADVTSKLDEQAFRKRMEKMVSPRVMEMKAGYAEAVKQLASLDPVLAYSLRNQDDFLGSLEHAHVTSTSLSKLTPQERIAANAMFEQVVRPKLLASSAQSIQRLVGLVSKKVSGRTYRDAMDLVRQQQVLESRSDPEEADVLQGITAFVKAQSAARPD